MTYEFLPREEPGKPLIRVSAGFADRVMQRFEEYERKQKRRRTIVIALTVVSLLGGGFLLSARLIDDGGKAGITQSQAGPVRSVVHQESVHEAPAQYVAVPPNAVKGDAVPAAHVGHDHPVKSAIALDPPGFIVIMLDGREYHCPPEVLQRMKHEDGQIEQARYDGKPPKHTAQIQPFSGGPCRFVPAPKQ